MKKIVFASVISMAFLSCGNNTNNTTEDSHIPASDTSYKDVRGVMNANGNIPDTSQYGASPHTYNVPKDSSNYDSLNNSGTKKP